MIPIGASIGAIAATLAGGVLLTVVMLAPPPAAPQSVWFDQPNDYATVAAGGTLIAMHASSDRRITQFRLIVTSNHEVVTVLNDTTPDAVFFGEQASPLVSGSTQWEAEPGEYRLTVSYLTSAGWVSGLPVRVTVPDGALALPTGPGSVPVPVQTAEPTAEPTLPPVDEPEDPGTDPAPPPPPPSSTPAPSATTPPSTPAPAPTGTVRRQVTGTTTTFIAEGVSPQNAVVDVQYQVTNDYNGAAQPGGSWTSVGCGNLTAQPGTSPTKYTCTTAAWGGPGRSSGYRTGHVRVVVTSAGGSVTTYGSNWLINPDVN